MKDWTTAHVPPFTIMDAMIQQSPTLDGWVCPKCRNHRGNLHCSKHVFISVVGANMSNCIYFVEERRKERVNGK